MNIGLQVSNFKLGIGIPLNFPMVPDAFFESFIMMKTPPFTYLRSSRGGIEDMRNNIAQDALMSGCSHLIMMDTDQIYHPETIPTLLAHKKPIVGCMVCRRYPPFDPLMLKGTISHYQTVLDWKPGDLVEVDATGTGCLMFETEVFRKMPYPWFYTRKAEDGLPVGEDIGFCSDLRAAGYQIYVDTSVPAGHLSTMVVNEWTWRLYRKLKDAEIQSHEVEHGIIKTHEAISA
jgi:hypothetical protein